MPQLISFCHAPIGSGLLRANRLRLHKPGHAYEEEDHCTLQVVGSLRLSGEKNSGEAPAIYFNRSNTSWRIAPEHNALCINHKVRLFLLIIMLCINPRIIARMLLCRILLWHAILWRNPHRISTRKDPFGPNLPLLGINSQLVRAARTEAMSKLLRRIPRPA